jgi:hypothetical protein
MADSPRKILENYKQIIIDALADSLEKNERVAQAMLRQSISINIRSFATNMVMEISMADYWKFVDKGVDGYERKVGSPYKYNKSGKPIPKEAMLKHIANRGITPSMSISKYRQLQRKKKSLKGKVSTKLLKRLENKIVKKNKKEMLDSMAWAMGVNLKKKGIKPTNFVDEAFDNNILDNMSRDLSTALGREILIDFNLE